MENLIIPFIGLIAIVIHLTAGYLCIFKPSIQFIRNENPTSFKAKVPIGSQEKLVFIAWPIVGYALWIILRDMGDDSYLLIPSAIGIHLLSFSSYFLFRLKRGTNLFAIRLLLLGVMTIGILCCAFLIVRLFFYFLMCITVGWIFFITPFAALAYYALFQVIAYLGMAIGSLFQEDFNRSIPFAQIASTKDLQTYVSSGWRSSIIYLAVCIAFVLLTGFVLHADFMGIFQLSYEDLLQTNDIRI